MIRHKFLQGPEGMRIGDRGPMGRILVRGEAGHDIIPELYPLPMEPCVDKPGKGAFFATDLDAILRARQVEALIVCGVTTEVRSRGNIEYGGETEHRSVKKRTLRSLLKERRDALNITPQ